MLKPQELEDGKIDRRVEAQATFVGAKGRVELYTVALLNLALALVILPDNAELDDALGHGHDFKSLLILWILLEK